MEETGARACGGDRRRVSLSPAKALLHVSVLREGGDPDVGMSQMEETGARACGGDRRSVSLSPARALLHVSVLREDGDPEEVGMG